MKRYYLLFLLFVNVGLNIVAQTLDNAARNRTIVSTTHTGGIAEIAKVIDGLMDTKVVFGSGNYTASFVISFPYTYSFSAAKLYFYYYNLPYDIRIEGSTDGITYTTLATYLPTSTVVTINLASNSNIKFIRVRFNVTGNSNKAFELQEFELIGNTSTRYDIGYDACGNRVSNKVITLSQSRARIDNDSIATDVGTPLVDNTLEGSRIEIFPNPAHSYIILRIAGKQSGEIIQYMLYDANGRLVIGPSLLREEVRVDLSSYARGIYFIRLQMKENISDWKIIKQ
ncbi:MAG TPA: T9SS type A sorting domain-containing protein [Bacteroidales bacterium]|mgnify:CR=1 FL=1|nr:T9SS type A sorting domain-containing protein [Bacteroidales bacterium]HPO66409.1 T9SS type A sorting domain-containing protein [Bacteroidales bacterium]